MASRGKCRSFVVFPFHVNKINIVLLFLQKILEKRGIPHLIWLPYWGPLLVWTPGLWSLPLVLLNLLRRSLSASARSMQRRVTRRCPKRMWRTRVKERWGMSLRRRRKFPTPLALLLGSLTLQVSPPPSHPKLMLSSFSAAKAKKDRKSNEEAVKEVEQTFEAVEKIPMVRTPWKSERILVGNMKRLPSSSGSVATRSPTRNCQIL